MSRAKLFVMALSAATLVAGSPASAAIATFSGTDNVATTTSAHPNSAAAAASFDAAVATLGGGSLVTFESAPVGGFTSLTIAPGVTLTGADYASANQTIRNTSNFPVAPTLDGYNTTSGGSQFVEMMGGTLTFSFSIPVYAFGAYFSGIQTNFFADSVTFSDGTSQSFLVPASGTTNSVGALSFFGFTDVGKAISSITVNAGSPPSGSDFIGVDDVRFATASLVAGVPEPGTWLLMIVGFGAAGLALRRCKTAGRRSYAV